MVSGQRTYIAIDLKSFYASVECRERLLDPLTTKLVVADASRTNKTICLAVTPALKAYGLSGRSRLFEVEAKAAEIKAKTGKDLEYIIAPPRMALYMEYSSRIYGVYLRYFSPEDIHVYSIDEVFIDATTYLSFYKLTAHELAIKVIREVLSETGITATAGIAPNLYLCKIAMDIVAKHIPADADGVRIAELNEMGFRKTLWNHKPLTDFWRIGPGTARRLENNFMFTMGDIARRSLTDENSLYKIFGIDAEIIIDHAWGYEPVTLKDIKSYKSQQHSLGTGQVLQEPYTFEKARIIVREMAELLALDLFRKQLVTSSITLVINYDRESLLEPSFSGKTVTDHYGRTIPAPANGSASFGTTNSSSTIVEAAVNIYEKIADKKLLVRKINISANGIISKDMYQPGLFDEVDDEKEESLQETRLNIIKKYGKNAILKGTSFQEGATTRERNNQIGGHRK